MVAVVVVMSPLLLLPPEQIFVSQPNVAAVLHRPRKARLKGICEAAMSQEPGIIAWDW